MTRRGQHHQQPGNAPGADPGHEHSAAADRPWREHHDHVPREFDEGSRRAQYRTRGDHEDDGGSGAEASRLHGPPGSGNLGPDRPRPGGPVQTGTADERVHAPTSGYDDYEAESLYARGFEGGDWAHTWQRGERNSAVRPRGGDDRGRAADDDRDGDQRLLEEISGQLREDPYIDARDVSLSVLEGVVRIEGEVEARWIKQHLEHVAARCFGVQDVDNRVRVLRRGD